MGGSIGVAAGIAVSTASAVEVGSNCPAWVAVGPGASVEGAGVCVGSGVRVARGSTTVNVTVKRKSGRGVGVAGGVIVNHTTVAVSCAPGGRIVGGAPIVGTAMVGITTVGTVTVGALIVGTMTVGTTAVGATGVSTDCVTIPVGNGHAVGKGSRVGNGATVGNGEKVGNAVGNGGKVTRGVHDDTGVTFGHGVPVITGGTVNGGTVGTTTVGTTTVGIGGMVGTTGVGIVGIAGGVTEIAGTTTGSGVEDGCGVGD